MSNDRTSIQPQVPGPGIQTTYAAPFLNGGVGELSRHLRTGKLKSVRIRGGEPLHFELRPDRDGLSGVAVHLVLTPNKDVCEIPLEFRVYEPDNSVAVRTVVTMIKPRLNPFIDPFVFDPIPNSRQVTYRLVLHIPRKIRRAMVVCSSAVGSMTLAGHRSYEGLQPVAIPYYSVRDSETVRSAGAKKPRVSVLIVTYNNERHIRGCLDSVLAQDYPDIEVVVVDSGSKDQTPTIIRELYDCVKLLTLKDNIGYCKANNLGLKLCAGELVYVLNPDTVVLPGTASRLVNEISISPYIALVGPIIDTKKSLSRYASAFLVGRVIGSAEQYLSNGTRFMAAPCGASFLIQRSIITEIGYLFDEGFVADWEDHDLGLRCWLHGYVCLHIPCLGVYHEGGGSIGFQSRRRDARIIRNSLLTYFKNYCWLSFAKAFVRTLLGCRNIYRILGVMLFLGSFWRYIPVRVASQRARKVSDNQLKILACGVQALIGIESPHGDDKC